MSALLTYLTAFLYFFAFSSFLQKVNGGGRIHSLCQTYNNFTSNDPYHNNLKELMGYFSQEIQPNGYISGSKGHGQYQKAYGSLLCYNVSAKECSNCFEDAYKEFQHNCPFSRSGITWHEECLVKYSNSDFFGQIENQFHFSVRSSKNVTKSAQLGQKKMELFSYLANQTSQLPKMYKTGETEINGSLTLYGMALCSRDLSAIDCWKCLQFGISELFNCCEWKEGARFYSEVCVIRYEFYKFF